VGRQCLGLLSLFSLHWRNLTRGGAHAGIVVGAGTIQVWLFSPFTINGLAPSDFVYEIVRGFNASAIAAIGVCLAGRKVP
jgi:SSS family solute:Na+ symporter